MSKPQPRLIREPADAEQSASEWLRHWGYDDVTAVGGSGDSGVDVRGIGIVGQVKAEVARTGRPVVQQLSGVAAFEGAQGVLFSLGGFTDEAIEWADMASIGLFAFDLSGEPQAINDTAQEVILGPSSSDLGALGELLTEIESKAAQLSQLLDEVEQLSEQGSGRRYDAAMRDWQEALEAEGEVQDRLAALKRDQMLSTAEDVLDGLLGGTRSSSGIEELRRERRKKDALEAIEREVAHAERRSEAAHRSVQSALDAESDLSDAIGHLSNEGSLIYEELRPSWNGPRS